MVGGSDGWKDLIEKRLDAQGEKIEALQAFRNWVVGGAAVVAYLLGMMSEAIRHALGIK